MIRNNRHGLRANLNVDNMAVEFQVIDKQTLDANKNPTVIESAAFPVAEVVHQNLHRNVALYGLSKLLQDRTSEVQTGPGKLAAMRDVAELLKSGEWERERRVGAPVVRPEVEALASIKGVSVGDIQKALQRYTKEQREKILASDAVVAKATEIRAAREASAASVDLSAELA